VSEAIARGFVVVSGAPGAGKSTLAAPLARELGLPLFGKDILKEALHDHITSAQPRAAWSKVLGGASMELIWTLAAHAPAAVLEADFRPRSDYERGRLTALGAPLVEVYCRCPMALAAERYATRHAGRHRAHVSGTISLEALAEFDRALALGPVIEVDTSGAVDVAALADSVRAALGRRSPA
jgi:predicted kinase